MWWLGAPVSGWDALRIFLPRQPRRCVSGSLPEHIDRMGEAFMPPHITVPGTGYVGSTHAVFRAELRFDVLGRETKGSCERICRRERSFSRPGSGGPGVQ